MERERWPRGDQWVCAGPWGRVETSRSPSLVVPRIVVVVMGEVVFAVVVGVEGTSAKEESGPRNRLPLQPIHQPQLVYMHAMKDILFRVSANTSEYGVPAGEPGSVGGVLPCVLPDPPP